MIRRFARALKSRASSYWWRYVANRTPKVFCISMQKTGTTSVGQFFQDFGFKRAGWPACRRGNWRELWYEGDYESLFRSSDFRSANVYEDSPWFYPNFYRVLYHRFPEAKFVLMERDPNTWWASMKNQCQGDILGLNRIHSKVYRRESEFFELIDEGSITDEMWTSIRDEKKMSLVGHESHYKKVYKIHSKEVKSFFQNKSADVLHVGNLEDPNKWKKLGNFLSINVPSGYECHKNKSKY